MKTASTYSLFNSTEVRIITLFAIAKFLIHLLTNASTDFGYFRDELYYLACSDHLDWGYVDHPPLSVFLLKVSRMIFGDSLIGLRVLPALAGSLTLVLTGFIAKELKGGMFAIFLSCLAVFVSLIQVAMNAFYSMNGFDILIWTLCIYIILRIIKTKRSVLWVYLGVLLGLGLLNKISVLFFGAGIVAALVLTPERVWLKTRWPYISGLLAFILFLPYIIWNVQHDWAHLEFIKNASEGKYSGRSPVDFIVEQVLLNNPANFPLWIVGFFGLLFYQPLREFRFLGFVYLVAFFILLINGTSKGEYLAPAYPWMFAAGAVFLADKLRLKGIQWLKYAYPSLMVLSFLFFLPFILPILPVKDFIAYSAKTGFNPGSNEGKELSELPQFYADMFGWKEKAEAVAKVYNSLSEAEKKKCAIFSTNYGRCGAIDFFGKELGLPKSIGNHNNYWIWGPGNYTGEVVIILGETLEDHKDDFQECIQVDVVRAPYAMPYENNVGVFLCRELKSPIKTSWKEAKHYE